MNKDKHIKGCPNMECKCNKNMRKNKYKADDKYCKKCGTELVYICDKCLGPLTTTDIKKKICFTCQAEKDDKKEKNKKRFSTGLAGVGIVGTMGYEFYKKKDEIKELSTAIINFIKK